MLIDLSVIKFMSEVASNAPAPGGGSIAAITAAQGIALTCMVAQLTLGKKKYLDYEELMKKIDAEARNLTQELLDYIDKDTKAYYDVVAVFSMPKGTDEEKAHRTATMQSALKSAAIVPFEVMNLCLKALRLTEKAVGKSNINAASDLGVAALNLGAGVKGAWLNVTTNLAGIKDDAFVQLYTQKGIELYEKACTLADQIYENILETVS